MEITMSTHARRGSPSGAFARFQNLRLRLLVFATMTLLCACVRTDAGLVSMRCARPGHSVGSVEEAILTARGIWYCAKPNLKQMDEEAWRREFRATQIKGIWRVSQTLPDGYAGGGLTIELSAADGRLINVTLTQ